MVPSILAPVDFKKAVGIDVGIKNYAYDSDGNVTPNPENLRKILKLLSLRLLSIPKNAYAKPREPRKDTEASDKSAKKSIKESKRIAEL